jgi:hypothetical protein
VGIQEFASSLAQFNQDQLDEIQSSSNQILSAVNAIKDTDVALLNTKVGTNADLATAATVFGELSKIIGNTSGLSGLVGTNADAAGAATMFARLAQIAGYTDTLETLLGLNTAGAGTSTVFAYLAKLAAMPKAFDWTIKTPGYVNGLVGDVTELTLVNIAGSGLLTSLYQCVTNTVGYQGYLKVVIDGVTVIPITDIFAMSSTTSDTIATLNPHFRFNSSLLVTHKANSSGAQVYTKVGYVLN